MTIFQERLFRVSNLLATEIPAKAKTGVVSDKKSMALIKSIILGKATQKPKLTRQTQPITGKVFTCFTLSKRLFTYMPTMAKRPKKKSPMAVSKVGGIDSGFFKVLTHWVKNISTKLKNITPMDFFQLIFFISFLLN